MHFAPIDIPDELLDAQEQGKLVIFAGAGISVDEPSSLPKFSELALQIAGLHPLAADFEKYKTRPDRFLGELHRNRVDVQMLCRSIIGNPASKPTELHRSLIGLFRKQEDLRIVTTNFDNHFRTALEERSRKVDYYHAPALPLGHQFSGLVYLHGCVSRPEPLVLTDEDFGAAYLTEGWAREFLQKLFAEFTTLFIGYSHNDIPVEYLARGMSGKSLSPRFALTSGEDGLWSSLGIREIKFQKSSGLNPFEHLYTGLRSWAEFTKQQPTDIAERVKAIVCAPDVLIPDKSQSSLLKRSLEREESSHFFTREARGWRWVDWLHGEGMLSALFGASRPQMTMPQRHLARWLAHELLAADSEEALLLVEKHAGGLGRDLWSELCFEFTRNKPIDWSKPSIQKWLPLLLEASPHDITSELSRLINRLPEIPLHPFPMALLRRLTTFRIVLRKEPDFASARKNPESIVFKHKSKIELAVAAPASVITTAWNEYFKPRLIEYWNPIVLLLENRLREGFELYQMAGQATESNDPCCFCGRIYDRDSFRDECGLNTVLDLLLGVVEAGAEVGLCLSEERINSWLTSRIPGLIRLGLYALHLSKSIPRPRKVELLRERQLLFPSISGAEHESWLVLSGCYADLNEEEKQSLWNAIEEAPLEKPPKGESSESWNEAREKKADRLTWFLGAKNRSCPQANQALVALNQRKPGFRGYEGIDQAIFDLGEVSAGLRTPKSTTELLESQPEVQLDWLLSYEGGGSPSEESREGLLGAVGAACAQSPVWAVALLEELANRQSWGDLWEAAFWSMDISSLPQDKLAWLLKLLRSHIGELQEIDSLSYFLTQHVNFSDEKRPSSANLELMLEVSLLIWKRLIGAEEPVAKDFKSERWSSRASDHPAGQIVEFWLKYCDDQRRLSGRETPGLPDWIKSPLMDLVAGKTYTGQLGRVILGMNLPLVYHRDPLWVLEHLLPKLSFLTVGEEAFLIWQPHVCHGRLSRDLVPVMRPFYREAFSHFHEVGVDLKSGFFRHMVGIVYSGLFDVNEGNWLPTFLSGLSSDEKSIWAIQLTGGLKSASEPRKLEIWRRWLRSYWEDRLCGRPCALGQKEAEEMIQWVFLVGDAFPEAVELVLRGPRVTDRIRGIFHLPAFHATPQKHPEAVLDLLLWLLQGFQLGTLIPNQIEEVLFLLPKRKSFLPRLDEICQRLASLDYQGYPGLRRRFHASFTEEPA